MLRKPVRPIERAVSNLAGRDLVRSKVCASGARADRLDGFVRNVVAAGDGRRRFEAPTDLVMVSGGDKLPAGLSAGETGAGGLRGGAFWRTITRLPSHRQAPGHAGGSSSRTDTSNTAPFRGYRSAPRSEAHPSKGTPEPGDNRPASHERRQNGGGASARKFPLGPHRPGCAARTGRGSSAAPG